MAMRPSTITPADILRWKRTHADYLFDVNDWKIKIIFQGERGLELWFCGEWFSETLAKYGATEEEIQSACFANGQRLALTETEDVWKVTEESLAKFLQGRPDRPGVALAAELIVELMK